MNEWSENAHFEWIGINYLQGLAADELINTIIKKHQTEKHILKNVLFDDDDAGDNNIKATNLCWTSYQKVNEKYLNWFFTEIVLNGTPKMRLF